MSIFIGQQCASLLTPRSSQMCLLFLVRPTRGRSMGDVLFPQSFGLRPPTGGYDSSDLLRRSQTTCIRNMKAQLLQFSDWAPSICPFWLLSDSNNLYLCCTWHWNVRYHEKLPQTTKVNQNQYLWKVKTTHSSLTTKTMSTDIRFYKK